MIASSPSSNPIDLVVPLRDLTDPEVLSRATFLLEREARNYVFPHLTGFATQGSCLQVLNAAKLSLLLVKTFVRYDGDCSNDADGFVNLLTSLELHQVHVTLKCASASNNLASPPNQQQIVQHNAAQDHFPYSKVGGDEKKTQGGQETDSVLDEMCNEFFDDQHSKDDDKISVTAQLNPSRPLDSFDPIDSASDYGDSKMPAQGTHNRQMLHQSNGSFSGQGGLNFSQISPQQNLDSSSNTNYNEFIDRDENFSPIGHQDIGNSNLNHESDVADFISHYFDELPVESDNRKVASAAPPQPCEEQQQLPQQQHQELQIQRNENGMALITNNELGIWGQESPNLTDIEKFNSINSSNPGGAKWTLSSMMIDRPIGIPDAAQSPSGNSARQSPQYNTTFTSKLRLLGKLVYRIFSQGRELPPTMIGGQESMARTNSSHEGVENGTNQPNSKSRRTSEDSLFSILIEQGKHPISLCRLLSDMIDIGDDGKAYSPFVKFSDVIQDLQQMVEHPHTFLFDPPNGFSPNLVFGQRYHGRGDEVSKILNISTSLEASSSASGVVQAVFVSGVAGSGKSHLVRRVAEFLSSVGWIVLEAKFERGQEHESRNIVSGLFDKLVLSLVAMRNGHNAADVNYSHRATRAITEALDLVSLSRLSIFIPSIHVLIPGIGRYGTDGLDLELSLHGLVFLVSRFMGAVLSLERRLIFCIDDLQWGDSVMLSLISELVTTARYVWQETRRFMLLGTYRDNEISGAHPLRARLDELRLDDSARLSEINLSNLSKDDVTEMIMAEMRLPQRLVQNLADTVHKKTSGHALFIVQFLNSLARDVIVYSPQLRRYIWDSTVVAITKPGDNVAALIVSNLSSLQSDQLQMLRVMSCFGTQVQIPLLEILKCSPLLHTPNVEICLQRLEEKGIVERTSSIVIFSHDLIQEQVYNGIPLPQKQELHVDIGTFLGNQVGLDVSSNKLTSESSMSQLYIGDDSGTGDSVSVTASLVTIAVCQINKAGPQITDQSQRIRFSYWNLFAGIESTRNSNFKAAVHYFRKGLKFLEEILWMEGTRDLCRCLYEGASSALLALGEQVDDIANYANAVIANDPGNSLESQYLLLRLLEYTGQYEKALDKGLDVLRTLGFDIPLPPITQDLVANAMTHIGNIASSFDFDRILQLQQHSDGKKKNVLKIMDVLLIASYRLSSPFLPLISCTLGNYSLQNGICVESAMAFTIFGYFKIFLEKNYTEGHRWGQIALKILDKSHSHRLLIRYRFTVLGYINFWCVPLKVSAQLLKDTYEAGMKVGDVDTAMWSLFLFWKFSFFKGSKVSSLMRAFDEQKKLMAKYSKECLKFAALDRLLLAELAGESTDPFSEFKESGEARSIYDEFSLFDDAASKDNTQLVEAIYLRRFFSSFWMGKFSEAAHWSSKTSSLTSSKMPKIQMVSHTFYRGLVAFGLFREGGGLQCIYDGKDWLDKMEVWRDISDPIFENKLTLLRAEHYASMDSVHEAKAAYDASIKSARDHFLLHEQGLAYEFKGKFLDAIDEKKEARHCFKKAFRCFSQWGAKAVAGRIKEKYKLNSPAESSTSVSEKRERSR